MTAALSSRDPGVFWVRLRLAAKANDFLHLDFLQTLPSNSFHSLVTHQLRAYQDTAPVYGDGGTLQSKDHRDLLDIIDNLRSQGINRFVDLPQIIVCGDRSAGKSSVLEAISHMSFPAKDNLCTRFATELILRRSVSMGVKVHIIPSLDRSKEEKKRLSAFS